VIFLFKKSDGKARRDAFSAAFELFNDRSLLPKAKSAVTFSKLPANSSRETVLSDDSKPSIL